MGAIPRTHSTIYILEHLQKVDKMSRTYVVLEDIIRNQGFVNTRILVRLEVNESLIRDALMRGFLWIKGLVSRRSMNCEARGHILLLGAIADVGVVTGEGSK